MKDIINALKDTPIPTLLVLAGLFFLILSFVSKLGGVIEVQPNQKRLTIPLGLILLILGLVLNSTPTRSPSGIPVTQLPQSSSSLPPNAVVSPSSSTSTPNPSSSPTISPSISPRLNPPPTNSPLVTQSNEDVLFHLQECRSDNEALKCEFLVTDQTQNRDLCIYGKYTNSSAITNQGKQYVAKSVTFGNKKNKAYVCQKLARGIGLTALITFEDVPTQINHLDLVEVAASLQDQGSFTIHFRDIPASN
ncbi:MAG: hypothetical protein KME45_03240 [Stenomitos rutilans HA7619-LM2]|jgi:hypothetical protein|nr:hypothetical protein [Stenomitos rutilans HA7619-LM2]MBW4469399.1 hypothetical protein [Stenomitos rutilans HA7619-LM2]